MTPEERARLRAHILAAGLAGDTATARSSVVANAEALAAGDPDKHLGIGSRGRDGQGVMDAVATLCGCSPSLDERDGAGVIDPERLLDPLALVAERFADLARAGGRVLIATGHPTGVLAMYQAIARALAGCGVKLEAPLEDEDIGEPDEPAPRRIRYLDGVAVLASAADLLHTHASWPMERLLATIDPPDLVLADHGFAGAAIAQGLEVACFTDVNDPAIAVAWHDGLTRLVVPLDDNRPPSTYDPIAEYLVSIITQSG